MKVFLQNIHEATDFIWSGQAYTSFNLLPILNFFYENYWPPLTWSSKCRGSVSHGDIKFWFSGNAYTGRHCLSLQFHLSYYIRCTVSFKKIADTSFKISFFYQNARSSSLKFYFIIKLNLYVRPCSSCFWTKLTCYNHIDVTWNQRTLKTRVNIYLWKRIFFCTEYSFNPVQDECRVTFCHPPPLPIFPM